VHGFLYKHNCYGGLQSAISLIQRWLKILSNQISTSYFWLILCVGIKILSPSAPNSPMNFWYRILFLLRSVTYLFYLRHISLLGLQIKTKTHSNSSPFCSFKSYNSDIFMSSVVTTSVHATRRYPQKVPRTESGMGWSLGWIPMFQLPFNSSCVALQYETGTKFFHQAVPELP
jgi:hypothetical protein